MSLPGFRIKEMLSKITECEQAGKGYKYLPGNNLPRIKIIRGKLFPDRYLLPMTAY